MSREHVDLILRGVESFNRRDVEGAMVPFHPDFVYRDAGTGVTDRDRDHFRDRLISWMESWIEYEEVTEDALDLGDRVVRLVHATGRGRASDMVLEERHGEIYDFRDGLVVELTAYPTHEEALRAAGLSSL